MVLSVAIPTKGSAVPIALNIPQERELLRLIDYERSTCSVDGDLVYRCAFPHYPEDDLQAELIERGALAVKRDPKRGTIVVIASEGYSYVMEKRREELEQRRREKRDVRLVALSALFAAACVVVGFALGRLAG